MTPILPAALMAALALAACKTETGGGACIGIFLEGTRSLGGKASS